MKEEEIQIQSVRVKAKPRKRKLQTRKVVLWRGKKMCFRRPWTIEVVQNENNRLEWVH